MEPSLGLPSSLGHKTNLNKFKSIEIISSIFSDHNGMKPEINYRKRNEKRKTVPWRLNSMPQENKWANKEIKKEIRENLETHRHRMNLRLPERRMWGGTVRKFGIDMYTLLYLQWMMNKDLLYSPWNSAQCYVAA